MAEEKTRILPAEDVQIVEPKREGAPASGSPTSGGKGVDRSYLSPSQPLPGTSRTAVTASNRSFGSPGSPLSKRERARIPGSPMSSLAVCTARRPKPSERQKEDKVRVKKKLKKRHINPGPGHYDPKRPGSTSRDLTASSAFRSKSSRHFDPVKLYGHDGDPGAYEPTVYLSLVLQAKHTFSQAIQEGKVGFGATADRILSFRRSAWNEGEKNNPGPSHYNPQVTENGKEHDMTTLNGVECMKSAAFSSESKQIATYHDEAVPGPGQYDPNFDSVEPVATNMMPQTGRDAVVPGTLPVKFASTTPGVGPGTYDPIVTNNGELDTIGARVERRSDLGAFGWSASFVSDSIRSIFSSIFPERPNNQPASPRGTVTV